MFKVGDKKRFLSPKNDIYEIKEIVEDPGVVLNYEFDGGICPDCGKKCKIPKTYDLKRIYVMVDSKGEVGYKGEMDDGELIRMPQGTFFPQQEIDVESKMQVKSTFVKESKNGNKLPD